MSQRIIDVDAAGILTVPIEVLLGGVVYTLPGDVPAPLFAKIMVIEEKGTGTAQDTAALYTELLALFQEHQPSLERLPIGVTEMIRVVGYIYSRHDEEAPAGGDGEDPTGPTPKPAARKRKPAARRSRSST